MTPEENAFLPQLYLLSELRQRIARGPIAWDLVFSLGEPGDPTDDLTKAWPDDRPTVTVGRLELDRLHEDQVALHALVFDPTVRPPGAGGVQRPGAALPLGGLHGVAPAPRERDEADDHGRVAVWDDVVSVAGVGGAVRSVCRTTQ
jgi:hypothetical protein